MQAVRTQAEQVQPELIQGSSLAVRPSLGATEFGGGSADSLQRSVRLCHSPVRSRLSVEGQWRDAGGGVLSFSGGRQSVSAVTPKNSEKARLVQKYMKEAWELNHRAHRHYESGSYQEAFIYGYRSALHFAGAVLAAGEKRKKKYSAGAWDRMAALGGYAEQQAQAFRSYSSLYGDLLMGLCLRNIQEYTQNLLGLNQCFGEELADILAEYFPAPSSDSPRRGEQLSLLSLAA